MALTSYTVTLDIDNTSSIDSATSPIELTIFAGSPGVTGATGSTGPAGPTGATGATGPAGQDGAGVGPPAAHAASHATGGTDAVTPASIGAAKLAGGNGFTGTQSISGGAGLVISNGSVSVAGGDIVLDGLAGSPRTIFFLGNNTETLVGSIVSDFSTLSMDLQGDYRLNGVAFGTAATRNVGTAAGTVAAGDHLHTGVYATAGHTHAFSSLTSIPTTLLGYGITDAQPLDADLTAIAALTTTIYGRAFNTLFDAAAARTYIGAGTGTGDALTSGTLAQFADTTSAQLAGVINDETGTGALVFAVSPAFTTPNIGAATGSVSGNAGTATALATARTINGVSFDGTANITATAAAGTLTGTVLNATVVTSSLTSAAGGTFGTAAFTAASAYATLDGGGKLTASQLPDLAVSEYLGSVASQVAMLALVGQRGDWCVRSDLGTNFILNADTPTLLASWTQLSYPASSVVSVAGRTGAIVLSNTDVSGLGTLAIQNGTFSGSSSGTNTGDQTNVSGNAATVTTNANLTGDVTSVGNATTLTNAPVIAKVLTGYISGAGVVAATDSILAAIQKLNGNDATNANLTGSVTSVGNATTVVTNANLTGDATSTGNATTVGKINGTSLATLATGILKNTTTTGVPSIAVAADFPTLNQSTTGNAATVTTNANLTGGVTSAGNAATVITNANLTGGVTSVGNAATVITNANLTGPVTSVGNATTITDDAVTYAKLQNVSATARILGRKTAAAGDAEECTISEILDFITSTARGDLHVRGAATWGRLPVSVFGKVPTSDGTDLGYADPAGDLFTATDAATTTFNLTSSRRQIVTLGGNRTLALANDRDGQAFTLVLKQDATGTRTVTWFAGIKWSGGTVPTLTTTAGKYDVFAFLRIASGEYIGFTPSQNH